MNTKAIIYCRVSSDKQVKEGHGLDSQEQRGISFAKSKNYPIATHPFRDEGISGAASDRPAINEMLVYIDKHKNESFVVIVDDLSRLARDVQVYLHLKSELSKRGVKIESPNFHFEDSPEGIFIENILAAKAQLDREQNARQVKQKMKARLEIGYWCFRSVPPGIKYVRDPAQGKILVNDEPLATIYKEAIESYEKNILNTLEEVRQFILKRYGKHNLDRPLSLNGAQNILTELLYTGYYEYPKWNIPLQKAKHTGFISLETYKIVQDKLRGKSHIMLRKDYSADFPLRPYVLCSVCGKPMSAAWCRGRSSLYPYYWCKNHQCPNYAKTIPKITIEEAFELKLREVKVVKEAADLTQVILVRTWEEEKKDEELLSFRLESHRNEVNDQISNLSKRISVTKDERLIAVYENQIKGLLAKNKELDKPNYHKNYTPEQFRTASDRVFSTLKEPVRMWKSKEYQDKTIILKMYFGEKLTYDLKEGFRTAKVEPTIDLINSLAVQKNTLVEMPGVEPGSEKTLFKKV